MHFTRNDTDMKVLDTDTKFVDDQYESQQPDPNNSDYESA